MNLSLLFEYTLSKLATAWLVAADLRLWIVAPNMWTMIE